VQIEYEGRDVLEGVDGRYAVRARESWYPNLGTFVDLAMYQMTFRYPRRNTLVAVGRLVSERTEGGQKIALWSSDVPMRVAGFNYGEFEKLMTTDPETGLAINVYTNRDWSGQARVAQADATNAARVATAFFGKPPFGQLSMTQQVESNFGQSWPSLVFLPTLALTTSTQRAMTSGIDPRAMPSLQEFVNVVGWHEVSHQWWGHQVGWQSYRDQWLSEGFAEFTAALTLEFAESRRSYDRFWALRRGEILERHSGVPTYDAGAITQGFRLATEKSPAAARTMLYGKGAYILHMLRMQMREDGRNTDPDRAFKAMMHDFVTTWAGKNPSTDDFQRIAEKHLLPVMDLARNKRLDYFFDQWVHGTDIPELTSSLQVSDAGKGRYRISGSVSQAGVPAEFLTLVPVYLDFGEDRLQRLGMVTLKGPATQNLSVEVELPQRPRRAILNARNDVLSR
jgi:aminopeptidase N